MTQEGQHIVILSDGKPGHLNQSLAYATLSGFKAEIVEVRFRSRFHKALSYLFERLGFFTDRLLAEPLPACTASQVVAAGSGTYYAALVMARCCNCRAVAVMFPAGYRTRHFNRVYSQEHDNPPVAENIVRLPINLCAVRANNEFTPEPGQKYAAFVIGGPNSQFDMNPDTLEDHVRKAMELLPGHTFLVATSRRTPADVDALLMKLPFAARWLFSESPANPIPDFILQCDHLFITADSTSMISESVSAGNAAVEILPLPLKGGQAGKFGLLVERLEQGGYLHRFDNSIGQQRRKVDLAGFVSQEGA